MLSLSKTEDPNHRYIREVDCSSDQFREKHAPKQTNTSQWQNQKIVVGAKFKYIQNQM